MEKKVYIRGLAGQLWYNATEVLAYALTYRPVPDDVEYLKKVKYSTGKNNHINFFSRKDLKNEKKPLLIYIHGGGWISGILGMRNPYVVKWAQKGFFSASVNYTYAPQAVFPVPLQDVFSAIDYIYDKAERFGIDTDNVVLSGESAGGYFISYVAACASDPELLDRLGIEFRHRDDLKIKALVSHCGCFDLERLTDESKPQSKFPDIKMMSSTFAGMSLNKLREHLKTDEGKLMSAQIKEGFPPSFLIWGAMDYLRHESFDLSEQLNKINVVNKLYKADGLTSPHAWSIVTIFKKARICLDETWDFILPYISDYFEKDGSEWKFKRN